MSKNLTGGWGDAYIGHGLSEAVGSIGDIQMTALGLYQMAIFNPASLPPSECKPHQSKALECWIFSQSVLRDNLFDNSHGAKHAKTSPPCFQFINMASLFLCSLSHSLSPGLVLSLSSPLRKCLSASALTNALTIPTSNLGSHRTAQGAALGKEKIYTVAVCDEKWRQTPQFTPLSAMLSELKGTHTQI